MPVPYGNLAPADLIRAMASPSPNGSLGSLGLENPPSIAPILGKLGLADNPFVRRVTDELYAHGGRTVKKKNPTPASDSDGSFIHLDRRPFALTCQQWIENTATNSVKYLFCRANPRSVQWTMNLRVADQKTLAGVVQHAWRRNLGVKRRTYFSEPTIAITFQSGNIMPVYPVKFNNSTAARREYIMPRGLDNFYRFVDLLAASRIVDSGNSDRRANIVYIMYTSHIYPSIVLAGMFTPDGFTFTDNAEDPNKIEWTANFTIYDSFPRFDNGQQLINSWTLVQTPTKDPVASEADNTTQQDVQNAAQQRQSATGNETPPDTVA